MIIVVVAAVTLLLGAAAAPAVRTSAAREPEPLKYGTIVRLGRLRMRGWVLGGGDVDVLPTRGHTPGSLSVYFPKIGLLHMADELNSYYPAFPEASPTRIRTVFGLALKAAAGHAVRLLTDGHTYNVIRGAARVRVRLHSYIDGYNAFDGFFGASSPPRRAARQSARSSSA